MQLQQLPNFAAPQQLRSQNSNAPAPTPGPGAPAPKETVSIGKEALRTAISWGNATGTVTGGATGLATTIAGLYVGVLGGAVVGAALGGGIGPVLGAVSGHGALGFLGTTFHTMGVAAKAGVVLGGAAGAAGSWSVGETLGEVGGKALAFLPGAAAGACSAISQKAQDAALGSSDAPAQAPAPKPQPVQPVDLNRMTGVGKVLAAGVGGFGLLSGAAGGFVAGAGIASSHSLVSGLLAHNVTLAHVTGAAAFGGAVGAVSMGVLGAVGGWKLVKMGQHLAQKAGHLGGH